MTFLHTFKTYIQTTILMGYVFNFFVSLCVCKFFDDRYFTKRDEKGNKVRGHGEMELTPSPVLASVKRTLRYHIGTLAVASFIIAVIQFIRACFHYFERMQGDKKTKLQKIISKVIGCCLYCLECCLDKISRNSLIFTAIYGDAFCPACCGSFALVWKNLLRVAAISFFSTIVTFLGKVCVPLLTAGFCGLLLMNVEPYKNETNSVIWPVAVMYCCFYFLNVFICLYFLNFVCFFLVRSVCEKHIEKIRFFVCE